MVVTKILTKKDRVREKVNQKDYKHKIIGFNIQPDPMSHHHFFYQSVINFFSSIFP